MKNDYYTGIGDKKTPKSVRGIMREFAYMMADSGSILRTGKNSKADNSFRAGCEEWCDDNNVAYSEREQIILSEYKQYKLKDGERNDAFFLSTEITKMNHPSYDALDKQYREDLEVTVAQLYADNVPSNFVVCYGRMNSEGHSSQIMRIASDDNIPSFNLYDKKKLKSIIKTIQDYYND